MNPRLRDILLFSAGLAIMIHQVVFAEAVSPTLVGAALTMMIGAPAVYRFLDRFDHPPKGEDQK